MLTHLSGKTIEAIPESFLNILEYLLHFNEWLFIFLMKVCIWSGNLIVPLERTSAVGVSVIKGLYLSSSAELSVS